MCTYIDLTRAFYHAVEENVFTSPPEGWQEQGWVWHLLRKIPGRRDGSQAFTEWLGQELEHRSWRRLRFDPCFLVNEVEGASIVLHIDDGALEAPPESFDKVMGSIEEFVLLRVEGILDSWATEVGSCLKIFTYPQNRDISFDKTI